LFSTENKKVIEMFKNEVCSKQIKEFVELRTKLYCKGVKKLKVKRRLLMKTTKTVYSLKKNEREE